MLRMSEQKSRPNYGLFITHHYQSRSGIQNLIESSISVILKKSLENAISFATYFETKKPGVLSSDSPIHFWLPIQFKVLVFHSCTAQCPVLHETDYTLIIVAVAKLLFPLCVCCRQGQVGCWHGLICHRHSTSIFPHSKQFRTVSS